MSAERGSGDGPSSRDGSRTGVDGTPVAVDVSRDRRARGALTLLVAGPVVWAAHFMLVYLVVEAGCTGDGPGLARFNPPVPTVVTLAATAVAALACLGLAGWGYRRWRAGTHEPAAHEAVDLSGGLDEDYRSSLAFSGFLLALLSLVAVLFVGLPALVLPAC